MNPAVSTNSKVAGLLYDFLLLFYCGLYKWVTNPEGKGCSEKEKSAKIDEITYLCNQELKKIDQIMPNCEFDGKVENEIELKHIRYPIIYFNWHPNSLEMEVRLKVRIKINPCVYNESGTAINGRHSKVWVIFELVPGNDLNGVQMLHLYVELEKLGRRIEEFVAKSYVTIIDEEKERDQRGDIIIRAMSIAPDSIEKNMYDMFNDVTDFKESLEQDPVMLESSQHIFWISDTEPLVIELVGPTAETLSKDILEDPEDAGHIWKLAGDSERTALYRMNFAGNITRVGGSYYRKEEETKEEKIAACYNTYRRLARNFSMLK